MDRDLDDDIPSAFGDDDEYDGDDFDTQAGLGGEIPTAPGREEDDIMERDLDNISVATENGHSQREGWEHTDTEASDEEGDDDDIDMEDQLSRQHLRSSSSALPGLIPYLPPRSPMRHGSQAERLLPQRSGGRPSAFESRETVPGSNVRGQPRRSGRHPARTTSADSLD